MKPFSGKSVSVGVISGVAVVFAAGPVAAQEPAAPAGAPPAAPAAEAAPAPAAAPAAEAAPAAAPAEAAPAEAAPAEAPPAEAAPAEGAAIATAPVAAPAAEAAPAEGEAAPPEAPPTVVPADEGAGESPVSISMFADAYAGYQTAQIGTAQPFHRAYAVNSPGFTAENGFSLSFLGLDVAYEEDHFGATGSVRFGPSVPIFHGNDPGTGIDNILQGYATWKPVDELSVDVGMFGTIFGAEVAESWANLNYTRGGLYYAMQPFWHTGLRAAYEITETVGVTAMLVNGVNNVSDDDETPSAALQLSFAPSDEFSLAAGGLIAFDGAVDLNPGVDQDLGDGSGFDRFFDIVATLSLGDLSVVFNADFNIDVDGQGDRDGDNIIDGDSSFYGLSLAAGYAFTDQFGVALRGEYLNDGNNVLYDVGSTPEDLGDPQDPNDDVAYVAGPDQAVNVMTGTLTLDVKPVPDSSNVILRWDNRVEQSSDDIFFNGDGDATKTWFASVVGLVVTTDG